MDSHSLSRPQLQDTSPEPQPQQQPLLSVVVSPAPETPEDEKDGETVIGLHSEGSDPEQAVDAGPDGERGDPFGDERRNDIQFKTMTWWCVALSVLLVVVIEADMGCRQTAMIMIAETISLGILSLPSVLNDVGLVPYVLPRWCGGLVDMGYGRGCILIIGLGIIATYTGYVLGQFKLRYVSTLASLCPK